MKIVALVSGGMDSVTLAYQLASLGHGLHCVSVDYGQRHRRELQSAARCAQQVGAEHTVLPMPWLAAKLRGSALTSPDVDVPDGHYAAATMAQTVVANRNMILLSIAAGMAIAERADAIATAVHAGDHAIYPDCRWPFIEAIEGAIKIGTEGFAQPCFSVRAPYVFKTKMEIARIGKALSVPYHETWSCYKGGDEHCGRCGTCVERIEALDGAGVLDETSYADRVFARSVIGR